MSNNETISTLLDESGMKPSHAAEALGIKYETLISIFKGKFQPSPEMLGDAVQLLEDVKFYEQMLLANPSLYAEELEPIARQYRTMMQAAINVENNS